MIISNSIHFDKSFLLNHILDLRGHHALFVNECLEMQIANVNHNKFKSTKEISQKDKKVECFLELLQIHHNYIFKVWAKKQSIFIMDAKTRSYFASNYQTLKPKIYFTLTWYQLMPFKNILIELNDCLYNSILQRLIPFW